VKAVESSKLQSAPYQAKITMTMNMEYAAEKCATATSK
jgi:hypothetical protein